MALESLDGIEIVIAISLTLVALAAWAIVLFA